MPRISSTQSCGPFSAAAATDRQEGSVVEVGLHLRRGRAHARVADHHADQLAMAYVFDRLLTSTASPWPLDLQRIDGGGLSSK